MFILRKVASDNSEINKEIGSHYNLISKEESSEAFKSCCKQMRVKPTKTNYAVITNTRRAILLCSTQENYIMTKTGKTFANVSKGAL